MADNKSNRKPTPINWDIVSEMCRIHCTEKEIADVLKTTRTTLLHACQREKGMDFKEYYEQFQGSGKVSLRRSLWRSAEGYEGDILRDNTGNIIFNIKTGQPIIINTQKPEIAAQIFLATQPNILGMVNAHRQEIIGDIGIRKSVKELTDAELDDAIRRFTTDAGSKVPATSAS